MVRLMPMTKSLGAIALLYAVFLAGANTALAADLTRADQDTLKEMREGDMRKLVVHREARPRIQDEWVDRNGNPISVADFEGDVVVLNFWATWCPPCREEMPSIDRLAIDMADQDLTVLAISADRSGIDRIAAFFDSDRFPESYTIKKLDLYHDRSGKVARRAGALGLPLTIVLDRQGREIARLQGEAEWDSPDAKSILNRMLEMTAPQT